jgi:glycerophosphoryl diester phosphodiesterase
MKNQRKMKRRNQPHLKFWQNFRSPTVVAHRGGDGAGIEKENSLKAFKAAYKLGYRWFETDVIATRDKKLIISHGRGYQLRPNKDLPTRTRLQKMTLAKIQQDIKVGGESVLLFEDLLDQFPDVRIFVDPKTYRSVPALIEVLSRRPSDVGRVCIGSFSKMRTIRVAHIIKRNIGLEVCTSILGPMNAYPVYLAARVKFIRPFAKYYVQETNAGSVHVLHGWMTKYPKSGRKFLNYAHSLGLKVVVYTPNTEKYIKASLQSGVDVVMSDKVKLLHSLTDKKHNHKK